MAKNNIKLLTDMERAQLPLVISRRSKFKALIKSSLVNYKRLFSNCLMIQGKPGTGKTTLTETFLEQMMEEEVIAGVKRIPGHVTPKSMYHIMKDTATPDKNGRPYVLLLDDVDCLGDEGCLELMKAAFDTKSDTRTNRKVFYMTEDGGTGFRYDGFGIIICNNDFGKKKLSVHQEALMDRVQRMSIDLEPNDMMIFTTHLLEKYINDNEDDLNQSEIQGVLDLFNNDVRRWMQADAFRKARVNYSIRLIKKFVDCQRIYGNDWKDFNITYQNLEAACQMSDIESGIIKEATEVKPVKKVRVIKKSSSQDVDDIPVRNKEGKWINPKTNEVYSRGMQYYLNKKYA
jgi:hypothetical protein